MSELRPLPPVPNLEFERKEAKLLLRQLRAGDHDASERARMRHPVFAHTHVTDFRLADAQLTIAREYGFASWPRLVRYFSTAERQRYREHSNPMSSASCEHYARALLASHAARHIRAGRSLAEYVPRFFGIPLTTVFDATVTEDEARLAVAREAGFPTWHVMVARASEAAADHVDGWPDIWQVEVRLLAIRAIRAGDLAALQEIVRQHPELLNTKDHQAAMNDGILNWALSGERELGQATMRPVMQWLASLGFDATRRLNEQLCGSRFLNVSDVQYLLDRGADPNWIAPNGTSVLEHALLRYWKGDCVDLIAARTEARKALWIAAGLGDVNAVSGFLDRQGRPTPAARAHRPDFIAVGPYSWPAVSDASDEEIVFEAFLVAASNGRIPVLEYLVGRGFPVNSMVWETPMVALAVGNRWTSVVECLVRCGADVNLPGASIGSAREQAQMMLAQMLWADESRRVAGLCGVDVDATLAERVARSVPTLATSPELLKVIALASDDARRQRCDVVRMENLVFGLLRAGGRAQYFLARTSVMDFNTFRDGVFDRVQFGDTCEPGKELPLQLDAREAVDATVAMAAQRQDETAHGMHMLAVIAKPGGAVEELLTQYGGTVAHLNEAIVNAMQYDNAQ